MYDAWWGRAQGQPQPGSGAGETGRDWWLPGDRDHQQGGGAEHVLQNLGEELLAQT